VRFFALVLLTSTALAGALSASEKPAAEPPKATQASRPRGERPLPSFQGRTLDYDRVSISDFVGDRLLLFCFDPEAPEAGLVAEAVVGIARRRDKHNFSVVGVALGRTAAEARSFASERGLDFPILDDSSGRIAPRLDLRSPVSLIGVDSEGYRNFVMDRFNTESPEPAVAIEDTLRRYLRLPRKEGTGSGELDQRLVAPLFEAKLMDGGEPFRLADFEGQPVVLVFFLYTCPHCDKALHFFKEQLAKLPEEKRPVLAGVSLSTRASETRRALSEKGLDFFPVLVDADQSISHAYGVHGEVPRVFVIDPAGRIAFQTRGWSQDRHPALARMILTRIAGEKVPLLLNRRGYTGNDVCAVCHQREHDAWLYSRHAHAYDVLVTVSQERNPLCVGCHVVGFDEAGGFTIGEHPVYLENVGCETCHRRAGGHLAPDFAAGVAKQRNFEDLCLKCHTPTHSLAFDYATAVQRISHQAITTKSDDERKTLIAGRRRSRDTLPIAADYVGSDACKSCHEVEFATWLASPHAQALASLEGEQASAKAECLQCHTTGFGLPGGFEASNAAREHPDLARVGCESCHGPGSAHVPEGAKRFGDILSLGDKCGSCVILQICGACHDEDRDPGFEFHVAEKIEKQLHGTTRPGTSEPLDHPSTVRAPGSSTHGDPVRAQSDTGQVEAAAIAKSTAANRRPPTP
jgi:peroxiredoxin